MKAEVSVHPALHPWTKTFRLLPTRCPSSAWDSSSPPPPRVPAPSCEKMHPGRPDPDPSPDPPLPESQLDFFHKLGYSTAQVQAVQQTFGASSDTDKLLGQLVRIGAGGGVQQSPPETTVSAPVPRGDPQAGGAALQVPVPGQVAPSREEGGEQEDVLRAVVIDGSNVAMSHGNKEVFSCLGIQLAVNFFLDRGHSDVTVFVPSWRKEQPRPDVPITDQHILRDLERRKILVFTPSRRIAGKRVVCNDDCFIVKHGYESDGVIVSNDMYRDLQGEKPEWKRFIEERLLMYSFVNNKFMPPDDPLGRHGPTLQNFLRKFPKTPKKQPCPYGKKCTYGIKCKFHHLERAKQSNRLLADELRENAKQPSPASSSPVPGLSLLLVEDMAKKLSLAPESSPTKKDPKNEQVRTSHRKRSSSRKEKSGQHRGSQEQLDSGLGSIDSQPAETPWTSCDHPYGSRQQFCPQRGALCSSCAHTPPSGGTTVSFNPRSVAPVSGSSSDVLPYSPPHYVGYYPVSLHAYSQPADLQHHHIQQRQPYWSDPFVPPAVPSLWEVNRTQPSPVQKEREVVRKKLLAIFSSPLVDTAMNMFPQVMDPQVLVAEILALQSQNRSLR